MAPLKKSYGASSGRTYKTTLDKSGRFKRVSYRKAKKPSKVSLFQEPSMSLAERKNFDVSTVGTPGVENVFQSVALMNPALGTDASGRVGRKTTLRSLFYRFTAGGGAMRVLMVYDKQSNGANAAVTDVLTNNTYTALQNLSNSDRFIILSDEIYTVAQDGASSSTTVGVQGKKFTKMCLEQVYAPGAVVIPQSGNIFGLFCLRGLVVGGLVTLETRVRYTDV